MNYIIGLCHFCESHGPRVLFHTYPVFDVDTGNNCASTELSCPACTSIGLKSLVSKENETIIYCSKQIPATPAIESILKQASVRSLSCEVSCSKDNALIIFGNTSQHEYVLSYTFQLKDTRARGLKRLFSIIIIMKDKMHLLNLTSHFTKQIECIVEELKHLCDEVYAKEQDLCSQRALRLKREKMVSEPPRSLVELTGKVNVFAYLHMKFSGILSSASKVFKEVNFKGNNLPDINNTSSCVNEFTLNKCRKFLQEDIFNNVLYCTLVGVQVIVRGDTNKCSLIIQLLESLLPTKPVNMECSEYVSPMESRLFSCKTNVAVPQPCSGVCRLDIINDEPVLHWCAHLPEKLPTVMLKILKIMDVEELTDSTIMQQVFALREEWKNHAMVLNAVSHSPQVMTTMKRSLGIKSQDESLIEYWMSNFIP